VPLSLGGKATGVLSFSIRISRKDYSTYHPDAQVR
jgi:hypothetical protein